MRKILSYISIAVLAACENTAAPATIPQDDDYTVPPHYAEGEVWPAKPSSMPYRTMVEEALGRYREGDHIRWLQDGYTPTSQYVNFYHQVWGESETLQFDEEGVPQVANGGVFYDHPVTLCRYAFHLHGRIVRGEPELQPLFEKVVDRLLSMQDERGAFLYPYAYRLYGHNFAPGWPSGMSQGMALSVLNRAYALNSDPKYIDAGNRALEFLAIPREQGGVTTTLADLHPSLSDYIWIEEFATIPANYKLNGFLFTLIGLYDWWQRDPMAPSGPSKEAGDLFRAGVRTVENTLHYFDLGGYTSTDLRYIVTPGTLPRTNSSYHRVHIYQLHVLAEITGSEILLGHEKLWRWYVGDEWNFRL